MDVFYEVCHDCQLGLSRSIEDDTRSAFAEKHVTHNGGVIVVTQAQFLQDYLRRGYIDQSQPNLKPLALFRKAGPAAQDAPFGTPKEPHVLRQPVKVAEPMPKPITIDARPSWDEYFMRIAETVSQRATCIKLHVGAVMVDLNHEIVATGYNGAPAGLRHCDHADGADIDQQGHCYIAEHAERNCLLKAQSPRMRGATMYLTVTPCLACSRMMLTAGISRIVFRNHYHTDNRLAGLLTAAQVELEHLGGNNT